MARWLAALLSSSSSSEAAAARGVVTLVPIILRAVRVAALVLAGRAAPVRVRWLLVGTAAAGADVVGAVLARFDVSPRLVRAFAFGLASTVS